jgi:hypothetical protein
VNVGIEVFQLHIAVKEMLRAINLMLGVRWLPQKRFHYFDNVLTPVFVRALVIVIPFHILESV